MILLYLILLCLSLERPALAAGTPVQARITAAKWDIDDGLTKALEAFRNDCGRYPCMAEGWAALMQCPTNIPAGRWHGPYLDKIPVDPWGNDFVYVCPGLHHPNGFDLYSCGMDGISKSKGGDPDDINNWDTNSPHSFRDPGLDDMLNGMLKGTLAVNVLLALVILVVWMDGRTGKAAAGLSFNRKTWKGLGSVIWFSLGLGLARYWPEGLLPDWAEADVMIIICGLTWYVFGLVLAISGVRSRTNIGILAGLAGLFNFLILIPFCIPRLAG
jgi:general secretion pathway protein G